MTDDPLDEFFAGLGRAPDFDADELLPFDSADRLLLETAGPRLDGAADLVVIGDTHGALTIGAAALHGARGIRVQQDPLLGERALRANALAAGLSGASGAAEAVFAHHPLGHELLAGATTVLLRLPRGLDALEEIAWTIARAASPEVRVFAGDRVKHMTLAQNTVLSRYFSEVRPGLAKRKARVIEVSGPKDPGPAPTPVWAGDPDLTFELAAFGATFGGPKLDRGSRLLLDTLRTRPPAPPRRVLDLGCGNGVLAVSAALLWPEAEIIASDQSAAAVAATALTAERAGVAERIEIHRADGAEAVADGSVDLVLLNPPFHTGSTVHPGVAHRLIRDAARVLAPGGELRLVFNSPLAYRGLVARTVGAVEQCARDRTFTVLAAGRP